MTQHNLPATIQQQHQHVDGLNTTSYEQSRRQISSVVVSEEVLGEVPTDGGVRYVEVPVIEEVVRTVPKREVVEVEKVVPRYEVQWVEREVTVPQVVYLEKHVERPQVQEVIRTVRGPRQVQDVPREVVRTIPRVEYVQVEKVVQVPGEIIEVPKPYVVEQPASVKRWRDSQIPVVVAQTIRPVVSESQEVVDVDVFEYEPEVIPVDVHVAKPVASHLVAVGATEEVHAPVSVPAAQYNSLLRQLNSHLSAEEQNQLPYMRGERGDVPFLAPNETPGMSAIAPNARITDGPIDIRSRNGINNTTTLTNLSTTQQTLPGGLKTSTSITEQQPSYYNNNQPGNVTHRGAPGPPLVTSTGSLPPTYPQIASRELGSTEPSARGKNNQRNSRNGDRSLMVPSSRSRTAVKRRSACQC